MRRRIVVGNWKMNGDFESDHDLLIELTETWTGSSSSEVAVCPPYPYLAMAADVLADTNIGLGAQDVSEEIQGAYTGDVSATMLADCKCRYVIVGHSERRQFHGESSALVGKKFSVAIKNNLTPILCVGETLEQREAGQTFSVISEQLRDAIDVCGLDSLPSGLIAYEPVWAIGTGMAATPELAQEVHAYIRKELGHGGSKVRILYGGSVKPESASALFEKEDIDGALVGGASLKAKDFVAICRAAE